MVDITERILRGIEGGTLVCVGVQWQPWTESKENRGSVDHGSTDKTHVRDVTTTEDCQTVLGVGGLHRSLGGILPHLPKEIIGFYRHWHRCHQRQRREARRRVAEKSFFGLREKAGTGWL